LCSSSLLISIPPFSPLFSSSRPSPSLTYSLSLHDALPISFDILLRIEQEDAYASELLHSARYVNLSSADHALATELVMGVLRWKSEEHTSELQSRFDLVCRLLLEKKKKNTYICIVIIIRRL